MKARLIVMTAIVGLLAVGVMMRPAAEQGVPVDTPAAAPGGGPTDGAAARADATIDSVRLLVALSVLAHDSMEGRAAGSEGAARARRFLVDELGEIGVTPLGDAYEHAFPMGDRGTGVNLLGRIPGRTDGPWIVLGAHYDHEGIRAGQVYNGADDNASGTAAVLEIARVLVADPPEHPVLVALWDDEEQGLRGARAFAADPPVPLEDIALNVNLDMVSRTGGLLWAGGAHHTPALRPVLEAVAAGAPLDLRLGHDRPNAPEGDDWTMQSDHAAFHEQGVPFVYFGVEDHPDYHRPTDDVERVDPGEFVRSARAILMAVRALDAALPLPPPTP